MKYNGNNLEEVLKAHELWLMNPFKSGNNQNESRADLREAELRGAYLRGADLRGADLHKADLREADLHKTDLVYANLYGADLRGADLCGADLFKAKLIDANLRKAKLIDADLREADLCETDLSNADLRGADLSNADLCGADLYGVNLRGADLCGADLIDAKNIPYIPMACPDTGSFIGWKGCNAYNGKVIVKLLVPEDAKRSSGTGRKCRCDKAVVLEIQTMKGEPLDGVKAYSNYDTSFVYEVGKIVTPKNSFYKNRFDECSSGIHFFINRQEAVNYNV